MILHLVFLFIYDIEIYFTCPLIVIAIPYF